MKKVKMLVDKKWADTPAGGTLFLEQNKVYNLVSHKAIVEAGYAEYYSEEKPPEPVPAVKEEKPARGRRKSNPAKKDKENAERD